MQSSQTLEEQLVSEVLPVPHGSRAAVRAVTSVLVRGALLAAGAAMLHTTVAAGNASALVDPVGDAANANVDLVGMTVVDSGGSTNFTITFDGPPNLDDWTAPTALRISLDNNGDGIEDANVFVTTYGVRLAVGGNRAGCVAPWVVQRGTTMFFPVPSACLEINAATTWFATMQSGNTIDRLPATGQVPTSGSSSNAPVVAIAPARLADTRTGASTVDGRQAGTGALGAGKILTVDVTGRGGVRSDATVALLNVTAVSPRDTGFFTIWSCAGPTPNASQLNYTAGQVVANAVTVGLDAGRVCIFTHATTDLIVDVTGYVRATDAVRPVTPARLADTRTGAGTVDGRQAGTGVVAAAQTLRVNVAGRGGIAADATTVSLNVTAVNARGAGFLTVWSCDGPVPTASNSNYRTGQVVANMVTTELSGGDVCIFTQAATDLIVDVTATIANSGPIHMIRPTRYLDTRGGPTVFMASSYPQRIYAGGVYDVQTVGRASNVTAASGLIANVTVVNPTGPGFLTVYPCESPRPNASTLNYNGNDVVANTVLVASSNVCVYTFADADIIVDIVGYTD